MAWRALNYRLGRMLPTPFSPSTSNLICNGIDEPRGACLPTFSLNSRLMQSFVGEHRRPGADLIRCSRRNESPLFRAPYNVSIEPIPP